MTIQDRVASKYTQAAEAEFPPKTIKILKQTAKRQGTVEEYNNRDAIVYEAEIANATINLMVIVNKGASGVNVSGTMEGYEPWKQYHIKGSSLEDVIKDLENECRRQYKSVAQSVNNLKRSL